MRDRSQGFPCPVQHQLATGCVTSAAPRASSSHWPGSSADGCRRGRSPITIPQPSPAALRRTGERGRVPDLRRCAVIRLRHPATEANASSRLATFQQLVTTPDGEGTPRPAACRTTRSARYPPSLGLAVRRYRTNGGYRVPRGVQCKLQSVTRWRWIRELELAQGFAPEPDIRPRSSVRGPSPRGLVGCASPV